MEVSITVEQLLAKLDELAAGKVRQELRDDALVAIIEQQAERIAELEAKPKRTR